MNKYKDLLAEMPTINKTYQEINALYKIKITLSDDKMEELEKQKKYWDEMLETLDKYNTYFSDYGWIIYGSMNLEFAKKCIEEYESRGLETAEEYMLDYYLNKENGFNFKSKLFRDRFNLLNQGLDAHFSNDFYKSVPIFLIIADSVVNEYTKTKGFFTDDVDMSCWDSLVNLSSGLNKIKSIYNKSRKRVNYEEIKLPYRNGILHGRDLNFANKYVSCKSLVLLLALDNWLIDKKDEEVRKEKYRKESNPPSIKESMKKIAKIRNDRKIIESYKRINYIINEDFPEFGDVQDYENYDFIKPIVNFYNLWKNKNYGFMVKEFDKMFFGKNKNEKIKSCRERFESKKVNRFKIIDIEDRSISMKTFKVEFEFEEKNKTMNKVYDIGIIFYNENDIAIPNYDEGEWKISYFNEEKCKFKEN